MVAVISTSLTADWRHAATPKHRVRVMAVANSSTDKNWLTRPPQAEHTEAASTHRRFGKCRRADLQGVFPQVVKRWISTFDLAPAAALEPLLQAGFSPENYCGSVGLSRSWLSASAAPPATLAMAFVLKDCAA